MLAPATDGLAGPVLQVYRAPTDNDKGFGNWLARDWKLAGLTRSNTTWILFKSTGRNRTKCA